MKVLSFSYCFPNHAQPTWGVFVQQRLAALAERAELQVAAPVPSFPVVSRLRGWAGPACEQWQGLTVHRPRFFCVPGVFKNQDGRLYARGLRKWLAELIRSWRPDVLDAHFAWPDGVGVSLLAKTFDLPYTVTLRGKIYPCLDVPSQRRQCGEALRGAAAVISVSAPLADVARELGVADDRLYVIPNGVDTKTFYPRDKAAARRELGLPPDGRLIVTVAHLGHRKGNRETIRALADLDGDVSLVLVGGDPEGGRNVEAIKVLAAELGLADRVIMVGRQPYDKVPLYFNAADVSVLASYREGCPNVVLESLASGTPVVATDVGAVPYLLAERIAGRLVPPGRVEPLTAALADALQVHPVAEDIAGLNVVKSWNTVAENVYRVLSLYV